MAYSLHCTQVILVIYMFFHMSHTDQKQHALLSYIARNSPLKPTQGGTPLLRKNTLLIRSPVLSTQQATVFLVNNWNDLSTWKPGSKALTVCERHVEQTIKGYIANQKWALQVFDAWAKPGPSLLEGRSTFVGNYHQCRGIRSPAEENGTGFGGNYCVVYMSNLTYSMSQDFIDILAMGLTGIGACLPDTCTKKDITNVFKERLEAMNLISYLYAHSTDCLSDEREVTTSTIIALSIVVVIGCLVILGTAIDLAAQIRRSVSPNNIIEEVVDRKQDADPHATGNNTHATENNTPTTGNNTPTTGNNTPTTGNNTHATENNTPTTGKNTPVKGVSKENSNTQATGVLKQENNMDAAGVLKQESDTHATGVLKEDIDILGTSVSKQDTGRTSALEEDIHMLFTSASKQDTDTHATDVLKQENSLHATDVLKQENSLHATDVLKQENNTHATGVWVKVLLSFSAYTNGKRLLSTSMAPGSIAVIPGLRYLAMSWLVFGHAFFTLIYGRASNIVQGKASTMSHRIFDIISNAPLAVEVFFVISGFLLSYLNLKKVTEEGWNFSWGGYFLHRYWRLTPTYMVTFILIIGLQRFFVSGATAPTVQPYDRESCEKYWWTLPLYINNMLQYQGPDICFVHTWSLAVDYQCHLLSPLMMIPFYYHSTSGIICCIVFILAEWILSCRSTYQFKMKIGAYGQPAEYVPDFYFPFYTRMGPFALGVLTGYIMSANNGRVSMNRYVVVIGWILATVVGLVIVFGVHGDFTRENPASLFVATIYNTMSRTVFGACVCWVIVACTSGYGGPIDAFLSWSLFTVLGRVTYIGYLTQNSVLQVILAKLEQRVYLNMFSVVLYGTAGLVFTSALAAILSICVEMPLLNLEKLCNTRRVQI